MKVISQFLIEEKEFETRLKGMFRSFKLEDIGNREAQNFLKYAIAPRPICFASTMNSKGEINLSPFSYFNLFSGNPPVIIFSVLRRVTNNTTKHTWLYKSHKYWQSPDYVPPGKGDASSTK